MRFWPLKKFIRGFFCGLWADFRTFIFFLLADPRMSVSVKRKKSPLPSEMIWVAIFELPSSFSRMNTNNLPNWISLDWKLEWWWVGSQPHDFLRARRQEVSPMLTHELHGAEAFVNPIASRNQHPLHHFLHSQGPDSFHSLGVRPQRKITGKTPHGIRILIWHLNVGIKFEGQPFKFRDEWRFGTKESPGFQPREFPWNELAR